MSLADDLEVEVASIFADTWAVREGRTVPEASDLRLGNDAVKLTGTVLYADLAESTALVNAFPAEFAAEIYKAYLHCAAKIIRANGGQITSYDGDRIMAVYIGGLKNTSAAKTALQVNYAVTKVVNPKVHAQYPKLDWSFNVRQAVGVDTSELLVARTGVRGANDLVWVGSAANYGAKLCALRDGSYASWITGSVYDSMNESAKLGSDGKNMWEQRKWTAYDLTVYRSSWWWKP